MQAVPQGEDWKALVKRQLALAAVGAVTVIATAGANKIANSDLMKVEKEADVQNTEAIAWDSFNTMVHLYEERVEALESELRACKEE